MLDTNTLKKISRTEGSLRGGLCELPSNYYDQCRQLLDNAFNAGDYDEFTHIQMYVHQIHEKRQAKIMRFAVYRSILERENAEPVRNILPEEENLMENLIKCFFDSNDNLDLVLDGYYNQRLSK